MFTLIFAMFGIMIPVMGQVRVQPYDEVVNESTSVFKSEANAKPLADGSRFYHFGFAKLITPENDTLVCRTRIAWNPFLPGKTFARLELRVEDQHAIEVNEKDCVKLMADGLKDLSKLSSHIRDKVSAVLNYGGKNAYSVVVTAYVDFYPTEDNVSTVYYKVSRRKGFVKSKVNSVDSATVEMQFREDAKKRENDWKRIGNSGTLRSGEWITY